MSLQVWLPLNGENSIIPDISSFKKESNITLTEDTNGWYKVIDSSHTSSRWGVYYDFTVKSGMTYTLQVYSKSTTGIPCSIGIQSFQGGIAWPAVRDTNSTSTEKLTKYTWTASQNDNKARIYLAMNPSSTIVNNYVFYKQPRVYEAIHNQGIANVTVTANGSTSFTAGKIGQGLICNGSSFWNISPVTLGSEASICYWAKTSIAGKIPWVIVATVSDRLNLWNYNNIYTLNTGDSVNNPFKDDNNNSIAVVIDNEWHHFSVTFGSNMAKLYIDGIYKGKAKTFKSPATTSAKTIRLAGGYNNAHSYDWNGMINDFRIYDNCLSQQQIKKIAQGLILHYPLNKNKWGNDNLIKNSMFNGTPWANAIQGIEFYKNKKAFLVRNNTLYTKTSQGTTSIFPNISFGEGKQYTISLDWCDHLRSDGKNCSLYLRFKYSDGTTSQIISPASNTNANWVHAKMTSTVGKNVTMMTTTYGNGGLVSIANLKLEQGTEESVFCPDLDNLIYNIEYDTSGYGNNLNKNGTYSYTSDAPKYEVSTVFNGTEWMNGTTPGAEILTLACWAKTSKNKSTSQFMVADSTSGLCISLYSGTIISYFGSGSQSTGSKCTLGGAYKENDWNHFVVVKTGAGTRIVYCNGVEQTATSNDYWSSATGLFIGSRKNSASLPFYGEICDVRAYVTALSAEDVLSLYNNGAYIDQLSEIHGKVR